MTKTNMDLAELLANHDEDDLLRCIAEAVLRLTMEADVDGLIGAGRHERNGERSTWCNGYPWRHVRLEALDCDDATHRQVSSQFLSTNLTVPECDAPGVTLARDMRFDDALRVVARQLNEIRLYATCCAQHHHALWCPA